MDLEKYKKAWDKQEEEIAVSQVDIYKMTHKRSSSIVKWILIIGILEFLGLTLWSILYESPEDPKFEKLITYKIIELLDYLYYPIIFYFLYHFYKNYKNISSTDNTKALMDNILKTRKIVKKYIFVNIAIVVFIFLMVFGENIILSWSTSESSFIVFVIIAEIIVISIIVGIMYLIYQLLYGILLKKLYKNHEELSSLNE